MQNLHVNQKALVWDRPREYLIRLWLLPWISTGRSHTEYWKVFSGYHVFFNSQTSCLHLKKKSDRNQTHVKQSTWTETTFLWSTHKMFITEKLHLFPPTKRATNGIPSLVILTESHHHFYHHIFFPVITGNK